MPKNLFKWEQTSPVTLVQPTVNMMASPDFGRSIRAMVRALTFVTDSSHIVAVPTIDHGNKLAHTFGLGAMGLQLPCPTIDRIRITRSLLSLRASTSCS